MGFSPQDIVVLFSGFLGLLLAGYLIWHPGKNARASSLLAGFLCLQGCSLLVSVFLYRHFLFQDMAGVVRVLFYLESTLLVFEGMLLYFYCTVLMLNNPITITTILKHVGVASVLTLISLAFYFLYTPEDIVHYFNPTADSRPAEIGFMYSAMHAARFIYGLMCLALINRYKRIMAEQFSNMEKADTSWLFLLIKGFVAYRLGWLLFNLYFAFAALYSWDMLNFSQVIGGSIFLLDLVWLGVHIGLLFFGLKYSGQFCSLEAPTSSAKTRKVRDSSSLVEELERLMRNQHPYTNTELRLDDLAAMLSQSPKTLSAIINQHYHRNFCEFINHYRIEAAKELLKNTSQGAVGVLDISLEVGFNSKSAFNRAFKEATGTTPLVYRKQSNKTPLRQ